MILLHHLDGEQFYLNPRSVERIDITGDTVLHLKGGSEMRVQEPAVQVVEKILEWERAILGGEIDLFPEPDQASASA